MNDRQPPALPEGVPADLRDFIECKSASVTLPLGKIEWLPVPGADVTLAPGATPDSATINIDLGFVSIALPISVVDGQLNVDSTALPDMLADAGTALKDWVRELNDWFASKGRRLGRPTIKDGVVTLVKEAIPPAGVAQPPPPVPPPTPPPQGGPAQPPPPAGQPNAGESGGCLKWLGLALVLALGAGVAYIGLNMLDGPDVGQSPSPTVPLVAASALPPSPTQSTPTESTPTDTPSTAPTGAATTAPTGAPGTAVSSPSTRPFADFDARVAWALLENAGWAAPAPDVDELTDALGDLFLPNTGAPAPDHQDWVDLTAAGAYTAPLNATQAERLSAWQCDAENQFDGLRFRVACNQATPLVPGSHVVIATTWAAPVPDPFPAGSLCSYSVQTNTDGDPATGFESDLPFNYLIGADRYHEMLIFVSQGEFRNYTLATDQGRPPRPDTADLQGNLPTTGRAFWWPDEQVILWVIPDADFGDNWSVGGFCTMAPAGLAVDSLGHPNQPGFREYRDFVGE
jgi:hypothetical protein